MCGFGQYFINRKNPRTTLPRHVSASPKSSMPQTSGQKCPGGMNLRGVEVEEFPQFRFIQWYDYQA